MKPVEIDPLPLARLGSLIGPERYDTLLTTAVEIRDRLDGHVVWNVNATAQGGGVAEMLVSLLAQCRSLDVDARWLVLDGEPDFFSITKRLHNHLHGNPGDGGGLGPREHEIYERVLAANATYLTDHVRAGDIVLLHDPQTAGLVPDLVKAGVHVVFRSHIGCDEPNEFTDRGWEFLRPYLEAAPAVVVTRPLYRPPFADSSITHIIAPSIDPFAAKNVEIPEDRAAAVLARVGLTKGPDLGDVLEFTRRDGTEGSVRRHASLISAGEPLPAGAPYVLQVSRWDRLKDMPGVMTAFIDHIDGHDETHLVLAGPSTAGVSDDPEGAQVLEECQEIWRTLSADKQKLVHLVSVPMDDVDENAFIINAMQRSAHIVMQKSLQEGFGLTVTEAMWKGRAVIASGVGGIQDQIENGVSGLLMRDPYDLAEAGALMQCVLDEPGLGSALGAAAHERVHEDFLSDTHLLKYAALLELFV